MLRCLKFDCVRSMSERRPDLAGKNYLGQWDEVAERLNAFAGPRSGFWARPRGRPCPNLRSAGCLRKLRSRLPVEIPVIPIEVSIKQDPQPLVLKISFDAGLGDELGKQISPLPADLACVDAGIGGVLKVPSQFHPPLQQSDLAYPDCLRLDDRSEICVGHRKTGTRASSHDERQDRGACDPS